MDWYQSLLRPLLFQLPAETAHNLARSVMRTSFPWRRYGQRLLVTNPILQTSLGGLPLKNPVGLAPGLDKNADMLPGLDYLGFGYLNIGSILPGPRPGNPKPRIVRYPEQKSLINCYGLPSDGLAVIADRLRRFRPRTPLVGTIDAPDLDGYIRLYETVQPLLDAVQLNSKCPNNNDDHGDFLSAASFDRLLQEITRRKTKPLFVRITPYHDDAELSSHLELIERAVFYGVDAVTIPGTRYQEESRLSVGRGQLSGQAVFQRTLSTIKALYGVTRGRTAIKALGGISSGVDAFQCLAAGADSVELLTALVYAGPALAYRINTELTELCRQEGVSHISQLKPVPAGRPAARSAG